MKKIRLSQTSSRAAIAVLMVVFSACTALPPWGVTPTLTATATQAAPTLGASLTTTAPANPELTPTANGEIVLTVWMTDTLAPTSDAPGGQVLLEQLAAFDETHPDIRVEVYVKRVSGPGSTLSYLHTAPPVAPGILPDLALLDQEGLAQAERDQLVVPVGELVDPALLADLYPVAQSLGMVDDTLVGLPYLLEIEHSVYRETVFKKPPDSFESVLEKREPYVFPAGPLGSVNHTTLLQYMAAGGTLTDDQGAPSLDADTLAQILEFYAQAYNKGVISAALFQIADPAASWALYRDRQANLATTTSTLYLAERDQVRNTAATWIPTLDGQPYTLAGGWSWVVVTREPDRQSAAMALVNYLMNPVNQGRYAQAAHWLPTQHAALVVWGEDDPYTAFADLLLTHAQPLPNAGLQASVGAAIQDALESVILNDVLPVQAAAQAEQTVSSAPAPAP